MLKIVKQGFKNPLPDNDQFYLNFVSYALTHSDPEASITLNKFDNEIKVSILPSEESFRQSIIDNLLGCHRLLGLKIIFSKSLAISKSIPYSITFDDD